MPPDRRPGAPSWLGGRVRFALRAALSVSLLAVLVANVDAPGAFDRLEGLDATLLLVALALTTALLALASLRWQLVVRGLGGSLRLGDALKLGFIGAFIGQAAVATVGGDAMRVLLGYRAGLDLRLALTTVFVDRVVGFLALLAVIAATMPIVGPLILDVHARAALLYALIVISILLLLVLGAGALSRAVRPRSLPGELLALAGATGRFCRQVRSSLPAFGLAVVVHLAVGVVVYLLSRASGVHIALEHALVLTPSVMLVTMLPISLAGWGVREAAMVVALGFVSVPPAEAVIVSMIFGAVMLAASLPGAVIWIAHAPRRAARQS